MGTRKTKMEEKISSALMIAESQTIINARDLLKTDVKELSPEALATAWSILDLLSKKAINPRMKKLREELIDFASKEGLDCSSDPRYPKHEVRVGGARVTATRVRGKINIDTEKLKEILEHKEIPVENVITVEKVFSVNEKAIEGLIAAGILTEDELLEFTEEEPAHMRLTVKKSPKVLSLVK
jgi:hypothetical protein